MNAFQTLWQSTHNFLTRFDAHRTSPMDRQRHFMEEVTEFLQASTTLWATQKAEGESHFHGYCEMKDNVLEEAADVIVTTQNVCMSHGISPEELETAMMKVAAKNDAKTTETHHKVNGKITRRLTLPE